ncbi:MAG: protein-L-isoaspartate O-methyltransferase [Alphaproteobacteria bacterium]|nr:protein-L-isoaspartate O-methyltransferase [Alphaproteobacteria bacterium]
MSASTRPAENQNFRDFTAARFHMVEGQIRPNKVTDERILEALGRLPREIFVPSPMAGIAYSDEDLQIAPNRYLMEPMVLARLLQEAAIKPGHRVLDIGPTTGYSSAALAALAQEVVAVECDPVLMQKAVFNLETLKITNVEAQLGPLQEGWSHNGPYDIILINGSIDRLPDALAAQLAEGGRLMVVMRHYGPAQAAHTGEARLYEKIHGALSYRPLFDANIKPLPGFSSPAQFKF